MSLNYLRITKIRLDIYEQSKNGAMNECNSRFNWARKKVFLVKKYFRNEPISPWTISSSPNDTAQFEWSSQVVSWLVVYVTCGQDDRYSPLFPIVHSTWLHLTWLDLTKPESNDHNTLHRTLHAIKSITSRFLPCLMAEREVMKWTTQAWCDWFARWPYFLDRVVSCETNIDHSIACSLWAERKEE